MYLAYTVILEYSSLHGHHSTHCHNTVVQLGKITGKRKKENIRPISIFMCSQNSNIQLLISLLGFQYLKKEFYFVKNDSLSKLAERITNCREAMYSTPIRCNTVNSRKM